MHPTPHQPARSIAGSPADVVPPSSVSATILSILALVAGFVLGGGLMLLSALLSLCSLFGEECTPHEETQIGLAFVAGVVTFVGVPALVALVRRDARWLLALVVEVAGVVVLVAPTFAR